MRPTKGFSGRTCSSRTWAPKTLGPIVGRAQAVSERSGEEDGRRSKKRPGAQRSRLLITRFHVLLHIPI